MQGCILLSSNNLKTQCYHCQQMLKNWWFDHYIYQGKILSSSGWFKLEVARELKHPIHGFPKEGNSMSWRWPVQWLVAVRLAGPGLD